jgi:hypothetical protein
MIQVLSWLHPHSAEFFGRGGIHIERAGNSFGRAIGFQSVVLCGRSNYCVYFEGLFQGCSAIFHAVTIKTD